MPNMTLPRRTIWVIAARMTRQRSFINHALLS